MMKQKSHKQYPCPLTYAIELAVNARHAQRLEATENSTVDVVAYLAQNIDTLRMYADKQYGSADVVSVENAARAAAQDEIITAVLLANLNKHDKQIAEDIIKKVAAEN